MVDALNAEIALGTVASVAEGVRWLGYTYLFVRMRKNPMQYGEGNSLESIDAANVGEGISQETLTDDSQLVHRRTELIMSSAHKLAQLSMIDFDPDTKMFIIKDVGRIAAKYYIRHRSIEVFQTLFRPQMTEADILDMLSKSTEVCRFFRDAQIVV